MKSNPKAIHYRQGDVLIELIGPMPAKLKKMPRDNGKVILAYGEVTGHAHAIDDSHVDQFVAEGDKSGVTFLEVREAMVALKHDEHATINLPPGRYRASIQREYHPEAIRRVAD